jgi:PRD domain-containing protein
MDLIIFDIRWKNGYFIEQQNDLDSNNPKIIETYLLARDLLNEVSGKEVAEKEIISLSQSLITIGNYENTYLESNAQIEKTVDEFIALVGELAGIHFEQDDYLRGMLINHIPAMIMRLRNKIHLKSDLMEEIKYQYGVLYNFVWLSGKVFKNNFNVELTDNEAALLTIHLEISVEKIKKPMNIYVICPHSLATSELLLNQVRKITGQYEHIHKVEYSKASSLDISINDLVISSVELKNVSFPYIHVGTIMKEDDLLKIQRKFLANTMEQTQYNFLTKNDEEYTNRLIKKLLGKSVYIREKVSSVEKCLSKIIQLANEKNLENIKFEKTIRHRENLGITSTYTGIALPHANPKEVQTSELIMMTLEKPIYWGQNLIKVVMLIAIAEKELEFYKDALKVIYSKIDSSSYIQNLWKSEDYESFMTALFSEANFESIL